MISRYAVTVFLAGAVTLGLFYLMQSLISMGSGELEEGAKGRVIDFIRLRPDTQLELRKRRMPQKKPPEEPPPPPDIQVARAPRPQGEQMAIAVPVMDASLSLIGGPHLGAAPSDADIIPLVRVNPQYPVRASERGIEGWVIVEFTISAAGTVKNPTVIEAEPGSIFNRAAIRAIRKWKYKPRIEEGVAVERSGVQVKLTFELEE
jgi:protein TonB